MRGSLLVRCCDLCLAEHQPVLELFNQCKKPIILMLVGCCHGECLEFELLC